MYSRTELLIGKDKLQKIKDAKVIVFGVGGVGGHVCEMLIRAGVQNLTIVDFDVVDKTNLNRQIIALNSTIGKSKVEVMKARLLDINPSANIIAIDKMYTEENSAEFFKESYDYVIDAIDTVKHKVHLIKTAKDMGLNIVSAMGAGNRYQIPKFEVEDLFRTHNDGLAKVLRKQLKSVGVSDIKVVYTHQDTFANGGQVGSIAYYPAMCGCVLSAYVINEIIK